MGNRPRRVTRSPDLSSMYVSGTARYATAASPSARAFIARHGLFNDAHEFAL